MHNATAKLMMDTENAAVPSVFSIKQPGRKEPTAPKLATSAARARFDTRTANMIYGSAIE